MPLDGSAAKAAALTSYSEAHGPLSASGEQDCHTVVEQEHRAVQRVTRPMVGGKACAAAQDPLGDGTPAHDEAKPEGEGGRRRGPHCGRMVLLPGCFIPQTGATAPAWPLSNICDRADRAAYLHPISYTSIDLRRVMVTQRLRKMSGDVAALPSPACRWPDSARESAPARFMHCYCRVPLPPASHYSSYARCACHQP